VARYDIALRNKQKSEHIKELTNLLLENGAYSDKNMNNQLVKQGNNYTNDEKLLVELSWHYRKMIGLDVQKELLTTFKNDKNFLEFLKENNKELYYKLAEACAMTML
jgi:hypothetical protein